jgi:hypothetical protein
MTSSVACKWFIRLIMMLAIVAAGMRARAQDDDDDVDIVAQPEARLEQRALLTNEQFDLQIFGRTGSIEAARERMNQLLSTHLGRLDRQFGLSADQKQKLALAGQGDIKHALDRADELRRKFQLMKYDRNDAVACLMEARRVRRELEVSAFGVDSLFYKTLATTITRKQKSDESEREYRSSGYREAVVEAAARLRSVLSLTPEQHRRLKKLLLDEIRPPRLWGESRYAYFMYQMSRLPEDKVRPIFSDAQWKFLHDLLMSWNDAGKFLESDGFVLDDSPATRWRRVARPIVQGRLQTGQ